MTTMPWQLEKLSEKTLEINFASQLNNACGGKLLWFGLTQKQEANLGFDIATKIGAGLYIIQMKASATLLKSNERQFKVPHDQLTQLLSLTTGGGGLIPKGCIFYAFPTIGTVSELKLHTNILVNTWLCDVADIPPLGQPLKANGQLRKDGNHYANVSFGVAPISTTRPGLVTFHSKPTEVSMTSGGTFAADYLSVNKGLLECMTANSFQEFWQLCESFERKAFGLVMTS
jgi:hypothetical protein